VTSPVARWAERIAACLFFTLFPADCRVCGVPLIEISRTPVCKNCLHEPRSLSGSFCAVCGEAWDFPAGLEPSRVKCRSCQKVHRAVAFGSYDNTLRDLIHLLKFHQVRPLAAVLGRMLAATIEGLETSLPAGTIIVVPVPLHAKKKTQRGFNQAAVIARAAVKQLSRQNGERFEFVPGALVRSRDTGSQIGLSRHQRRENLRGAFAVNDPTKIEGRHILLVDDVYTTGATASECARVLLRAGARRVWVATVARTVKISDMVLAGDPSQEAVRDGGRYGIDEQEQVMAARG
jgi:ComF family protein